MSLDSEVAYIENMDEEELTNLVRLVSKLDPTETHAAEDGGGSFWNAAERALILGCQEAAGDFVETEDSGDDDDEVEEEEDPTSENSLSPYDTVVILTDDQAAALAHEASYAQGQQADRN